MPVNYSDIYLKGRAIMVAVIYSDGYLYRRLFIAKAIHGGARSTPIAVAAGVACVANVIGSLRV